MAVTLLGVALSALLGPWSVPAGADGIGDGAPTRVVDVVEVSGLLDGILASAVERAIDEAEADDSIALVLQVNSTGAVIDDARLAALAERITTASVPVTMWVGPSGSRAEGELAQLAALVDDLALAPGSRLGRTGPQVLPVERFGELWGELAPRLRDDTIGADEAITLGVAREAPTLPFFVLDLPGFEVRIDDSGDEPVRVPVTPVRFSKLGLLDQLMHTVASPAVAYLLFLAGGALLIFELYTAGVGVAGVVGAVSFLLGTYGLGVLPARWWAVALLVVALWGFAVDVQTGVPRAWSVIAVVALVVGSVNLYEGLGLSWITLVAGIGGLTLAMVAGMPAMVRTRFGTPTIGRDWMIGSMGEAVDDVAPEGIVRIDGAPWRARTNRATPVAAGERVRVVAIEGLWLEVEPETGGARDYRDRARRDRSD
ncbi:MAG: hypothetical protein D6683_04355 [Actinomyces sp.]|nr:MAG: hypothetical protein D6683_04355 [Actinomyces sp.]